MVGPRGGVVVLLTQHGSGFTSDMAYHRPSCALAPAPLCKQRCKTLLTDSLGKIEGREGG